MPAGLGFKKSKDMIEFFFFKYDGKVKFITYKKYQTEDVTKTRKSN